MEMSLLPEFLKTLLQVLDNYATLHQSIDDKKLVDSLMTPAWPRPYLWDWHCSAEQLQKVCLAGLLELQS